MEPHMFDNYIHKSLCMQYMWVSWLYCFKQDITSKFMKSKLLIRILILLICMVTGHRARGAGHRAQSTGRRAQSTGCRVQKAIMTASGCRPCTAHHALYIVPLSNVFIPVVRLSYQNNKQKYNTLDTNPANQKKNEISKYFLAFFMHFR